LLEYTLRLGDPAAWLGFAFVAAARLDRGACADLAHAALLALPPCRAVAVAGSALRSAGLPLPPFLGGMSEARLWAEAATREELKAVALAAFEAMSLEERVAFRAYVAERPGQGARHG